MKITTLYRNNYWQNKNNNFKFLKNSGFWIKFGVFVGFFAILRLILHNFLFQADSQFWWTFFWMQNIFVFLVLTLIYALFFEVKLIIKSWKSDTYNKKSDNLAKGFFLIFITCYFLFLVCNSYLPNFQNPPVLYKDIFVNYNKFCTDPKPKSGVRIRCYYAVETKLARPDFPTSTNDLSIDQITKILNSLQKGDQICYWQWKDGENTDLQKC